MPVICNSDQTQCLYLIQSGSDFVVGARYDSTTLSGTTSIPLYSWTHLVMSQPFVKVGWICIKVNDDNPIIDRKDIDQVLPLGNTRDVYV